MNRASAPPQSLPRTRELDPGLHGRLTSAKPSRADVPRHGHAAKHLARLNRRRHSPHHRNLVCHRHLARPGFPGVAPSISVPGQIHGRVATCRFAS